MYWSNKISISIVKVEKCASQIATLYVSAHVATVSIAIVCVFLPLIPEKVHKNVKRRLFYLRK